METSMIQPSSTILAEITLANNQEAEEVLPQEEAFLPEMPEQLPDLGCLKGEEKVYTFSQEEPTQFSQKCQDYLSDVSRPNDQKMTENKEQPLRLAKQFQKKELKKLEPQKQPLTEKSEKPQGEKKSFVKTHETSKGTFETRFAKSTSTMKSSQTPSSLQRKVEKELTQKEGRQKVEADTKRAQFTETKRPSEDVKEEHYRKKDEEEGFAEQQHKQQQEDPPEEEGESFKIEKTQKAFAQEFENYAAERSILSEIYNMRVSQFDVLVLFLEVMKLAIKDREQERIARGVERELQIKYMLEVVDNYKQQSKTLLMTSIGAGVFGIVSGAFPVIGHLKGGWIKDKFGALSESIRKLDNKDFIKSATKITQTMSDMQKSAGEINTRFAQGSLTYSENMSGIHRSDWDENTRTMEEIKDHWKSIENFLAQALQMYHDAIRQLYS